MSECKTLDEALNKTYDNLDILSPRDVAAFWAVVPKFLGGIRMGRTQDGKNNTQQMFHQFDKIITKSMEEIESYDARDMATLAISLAKIMDKVGKSKHRKKGSPQQILHDMLVGNNSEFKQFIFDHIACASIPILREFEARDLSNFIYAYGLAEHTLKFDDGSTFFDILADQVITFDELDEFSPQHLSNIVWAYATTEESNPNLFKKVANHIKTCSLDRFNGQDCSNTVWAYATAGEPHLMLFQKLADHIVALDSLDDFWPQALSNIVWAYATAGESHPELFKKVADHILNGQLE